MCACWVHFLKRNEKDSVWVTTICPHCLHVAAGKKKIHSGSKEKKIFCVRCNGISGDVQAKWSMKAVFYIKILGKSSEPKSDWHWPCSVTAIHSTLDQVFVSFCAALWHFRELQGVVANCSRSMAPFENSLSWAGVVHLMITAVKRCLRPCAFFSMFLVTRPRCFWLKIKKKKKKTRCQNQSKIVRSAWRSAAGARHFHVALADS